MSIKVHCNDANGDIDFKADEDGHREDDQDQEKDLWEECPVSSSWKCQL